MIKKPNIILIGGGGHCKSCIDVIEQGNKFTIAGIIDVKEKIGQRILGYPIIGCDDDLPEIAKQYDYFLITVGQLKSAELRIKLYNNIKKLGKTLPTIISPKSYVSKHATVGPGTIILHDAIINTSCTIGDNCIINSMVLVEHDTIIGNHSHISTAAILNGECTIGDNVFIGSNSVIVQNTTVSTNTIIGAGSVVIHHLTAGSYVGNPVKKIN